MSQANPTKQELDAIQHEKDLEEQRKKRKDSAIDFTETPEEAEKRKRAATETEFQDEGNKDSVMPDA